MQRSLQEKIAARSLRVGVIGLGYVGLPLVATFVEAGFHVTGIDTDQQKVDAANRGESYIPDISSNTLQTLLDTKRMYFTTDFTALKNIDAISICVPTPLSKTRNTDISYIISATQQVRVHLHPGQLVVLESTTYPGTTDEVLLPEVESTGLNVGVDFFLAFSPERVDPGNPDFDTRNTPKIVGGITPACTELAQAFYGAAIEQVVPVSSTRVAEMVKLLENTFRAVNIGLVNEIALMCHKMDIGVWEVIDAAKTKPFGYMPFYPGPGLGGHCIPIDPYYLSWKARQNGFECRFIDLAGHINSAMPDFVVERVADALNTVRKAINGS